MKLEIKNLSMNYGHIQALDNVSMELDNGIYGLLGPNGAGKSTLINLLTDNIKRQKGEILWDGTDILKLGNDYRKILGYMPQQQGYYEDFTAGAFLHYMADIKGLSRKERKLRVHKVLEAVNLTEQHYEKIKSFSGGMKQRLLLAQALLNEPKILILDEPTAGIDPQERIRIRNLISEISTDKIVILATHIVSDVESIAKEIVLLKKGQIIKKGTPYELMNEVQEHIYEIEVDKEQLAKVYERYIVSNLRHTQNGLLAKIISKEPPKENYSTSVVVNLEDVYLNYFSDGKIVEYHRSRASTR